MLNKRERRLGAVMFTDIVDFTKLMSNDESKALDTLQKKNSVVKSHVNNYAGMYIKSIGDGSLSFFDSAIEAVDCAVKIQKEIRNKVKSPGKIHWTKCSIPL